MPQPALRGSLLFAWLLALLMLLTVAIPQAHAQNMGAADVVLADGQGTAQISGGVDYLVEEPGKPLTAEQVRATTHWKHHDKSTVNLSRQRAPVWLRLNIDPRASTTDWLLGIDWPMLEDVRVFQYDQPSGQLLSTQQTGLTASAERKLLDAGYAFPLVFREGKPTTVLVRVYASTSLIVPLTVWSSEAYQMNRNSHNVVMGLLFGVLAIMLLYNASLFVFTRDPSYFYYSAYLLTAMLYELAITGYGPLYVWGESAWMTARGYEFTACLTFLAATLFFRDFLGLRDCGIRHLRWLNNGFVIYWVVTLVLVVVYPSPWVTAGLALVGLLGGLAAVYSSIIRMAQGNISARYFAIAWSALLIGTIFHILSLVGVIETSWLTNYGQHLGFVIEIVLLSIALADRIKRDRLARERAQEEALQLTQKVQREREEKIHAQEQAISIQTRAKEELELRVLDRTAELERAMKNLEIANVELAKLSVTDALTKVHNRRYFDEVLQREHDRSSRTGVPLALALADIDFFKKINDTCGHLAGDECLKLVATTLSQVVGRSTDLVARYGGEEFAIVLPATDAEHATEVAERVRAAVADIQFIYRGKRVPISISLGVVAKVVEPNQSVADFIAEADAALYQAKDAGRNRVMLAA